MANDSRWMDLGIRDFQIRNTERCNASFGPLHDHPPSYYAMALAGEVGELCNKLRKRVDGRPVSDGDLESEFGDVLPYLVLLAERCGVDLASATILKFNEVNDRVGYGKHIMDHKSEGDPVVTSDFKGTSILDTPAYLIKEAQDLKLTDEKSGFFLRLHSQLVKPLAEILLNVGPDRPVKEAIAFWRANSSVWDAAFPEAMSILHEHGAIASSDGIPSAINGGLPNPEDVFNDLPRIARVYIGAYWRILRHELGTHGDRIHENIRAKVTHVSDLDKHIGICHALVVATQYSYVISNTIDVLAVALWQTFRDAMDGHINRLVFDSALAASRADEQLGPAVSRWKRRSGAGPRGIRISENFNDPIDFGSETKPGTITVDRAEIKVVYVAGPFNGSTAWAVNCNIHRAEELGLAVAKLGAMPLIPHANTRYFYENCSSKFWYNGTMELMRRSDAVIFTPDWQRSQGARAERDEAERLKIPICDSINDLKVIMGKVTCPSCSGSNVRLRKPNHCKCDDCKSGWVNNL